MKKFLIISIVLTSTLFSWFFDGKSNVSGEAFLMTKGGMIKTCAGNPVYLEKYDKNGFLYLTNELNVNKKLLKEYEFVLEEEKNLPYYQSLVEDASGYGVDSSKMEASIKSIKINSKIAKGELPKTRNKISEIKQKLEVMSNVNVKKTLCDMQGKFVFSELKPNVKYYITTKVQWYVGNNIQGGQLGKEIILKEGDNKIIINK